MRFEIREARGADAPAIAEIEKLCFSPPWSLREILRELTENALARYLVGTGDQRVLSYAGLWTVMNEGHITNVAVHPDFRGRGFGAAMIEALVERTRRDAGLTDFTLEVRASNAAAIRLYRRAGFCEEGRRRGYYTEPMEDAIIMWLHDQ